MQRRHRLREADRFRVVREQGRSWAHPLAILCALPNDLTYSRFGFSVSRKVGGAVQRNRARRLLREAVRRRLDVIAGGWDLVFVARPPLAAASFSEVEAACHRLLQRARLLRETTAYKHEETGSGADTALSKGDLPAPSA